MIAAWSLVKGLPWRFLAHVLAVVALVWFVYTQGVDKERGRWVARAVAQAQADAAAYQAKTKEDNQFASNALSAQAQLKDQFTTIEKVRHATKKQFNLALVPPLAVAPACAPLVATPAAVAGTPAAPGADSDADRSPVLSLGAVWLWNAALTGQAAAAGACVIDAATGQASTACAGSSGLDLDAAWDNHAANAQACALDRANHQRLIDFLKGRP